MTEEFQTKHDPHDPEILSKIIQGFRSKINVTDKQQVIEEIRKQGINIFPLQPKSKVPNGSWKKYQTQKSNIVIPKSSNYAVVCGKISDNLVVVDFDDCNDISFVEKIFPNVLQKYLAVKTNRGYHVFVKCDKLPNHVKLENKELAINIDVQSEGRYVVGPTSIHPSGRVYKIISEITDIPRIDFQEVISRLERLGFKAIHSETDVTNIAEGKIKKGQRNESAIKYANELLFKAKFDQQLTKIRMLDWNNGLEEPLPEKEIDQIINDSIKFHGRKKTEKKSQDDSDKENLHNKIANEITDSHCFLTLEDTKEVLVYENGIYQKNAEMVIAKECEKLIPECTHYHVHEITGIIQRTTFVKREIFDKDLNIINLKNGLYNIRTNQIQKHTPKIPSRIQFPVSYDSKARCPKILNFLKMCLEPGDIVSVLEQISSILLRDTKLEKAHMHIGDGGNGKSTLFKIIITFCGPENVASISIHDLIMNRFAKAHLDGKVANIYADIQSSEIQYTGTIKMLISGDRIFAEKKGKPGFEFCNQAKMIFSANQLPEVKDDSNANFRRWTITEWTQEFREKVSDQDSLNGILRANIDLEEELTKDQELSGLLNILIPLAKNLKKRGRFIHTQPIKELRKRWKEQADPINKFSNDCLALVKEGTLSKEEIYNKYKQWCKDCNQVIKTYIVFNNSLFKTIHIEAHRQRYNGTKNAIAVWRGVRFKTVSDVSDVSGSPTGKTNYPRKKEGLDLFSEKEALTHTTHLTQNDSESRKESK